MHPSNKRMHPLGRRMRPSGRHMHPSNNVCTPLTMYAPLYQHMRPSVNHMRPNNPDHPTWQRCGSPRGQSKSRFTLSKVNKTLTLIGWT
jgi:hypothetical protein